MVNDRARIDGPVPEDFTGAAVVPVARRLFGAMRPKFFPASILPVLAGSAWGFERAGQFDSGAFFAGLLATVCVHAGANVLNDVGDDSSGNDRVNDDRIYPYTGGSRFIQTGIMSAPGMTRLGVALLAVAALAGVVLFVDQGPMVLWFGVAGILLAVLYSLGPLRLASLGLGELTVAVAFGVLPVVGAAWLQSGVLDLDVLLFALHVSAWVAAILLVNGIPDMAADAATGKRTLPVRLGLLKTSAVFVFLQGAAVIAVAVMAARGTMSPAAPLVPIALFMIALRSGTAIRRGIANRKALTKAIEMTLGIHTVGTLWLCAVVLYRAFI